MLIIRLYGIEGCPCVAMTATATSEEIKDVIIALGLRKSPVVLKTSPILPHMKFSILKRPSNNFGLDGTENVHGKRVPGLMDLLSRVFLKHYVEDLGMGSFKLYQTKSCQGISDEPTCCTCKVMLKLLVCCL